MSARIYHHRSSATQEQVLRAACHLIQFEVESHAILPMGERRIRYMRNMLDSGRIWLNRHTSSQAEFAHYDRSPLFWAWWSRQILKAELKAMLLMYEGGMAYSLGMRSEIMAKHLHALRLPF